MRSLWYNTAQCVFEKDVHAWKPYVFTTIFTFIISLAYSIPCYLDCKKSKKNYQLYTFALCTITVQKVQKELPALYICPKHNYCNKHLPRNNKLFLCLNVFLETDVKQYSDLSCSFFLFSVCLS